MKKGQEWIGGLFSLLLAGIIAGVALPAILPSQALKVTPEVEANEFENKAIIFANSLLSDSKLVYSDEIANYRGIFAVEKLDSLHDKKTKLSLFYPETDIRVVVKDLDEGKSWAFHVEDSESEKIKDFLACIGEEDILEPLQSCVPNRYSHILESGFPVAIRYSDGVVHPGIMKVTVVE